VAKQLATLQGNLVRLLTRGAPWTKWPNDWAFHRGVPAFWAEGMDENEEANSIPPAFDGTIAQILKLTLPSMQAALNGIETIRVQPLSMYRAWAPEVPPFLQDGAHTLQMEFNAQVKRVNFYDPQSIGGFRKWWQDAIKDWATTCGITMQLASYAIWREAHSARSENSTAASVFMGVPDEASEIVKAKPGIIGLERVRTLLVGLNYVFDVVPDRIDMVVEVREFEQAKENKRLVRKVLCGAYETKKDAKDPYPPDLLGFVDLRSTQPELGRYLARIVKAGHGQAWHCELIEQ